MAAFIECYGVYIDFYENIILLPRCGCRETYDLSVSEINLKRMTISKVMLENEAKNKRREKRSEINFNTYKKRCHNNQQRQFNLSDINTGLSGTGIDIKGVLNDKVRPREKCFKTV